MIKLAPSILSADFSKLGEEVKCIEDAGADYIHVDVMDGHFVPNISYGSVVMKSLLGKTKLPFDVHLMIENADLFIDDFVTDQTEYIVVHAEACTHLNRCIQKIKDAGVKAGIALNPATSLTALDYIIEEIDMVLIMSVNPGFAGQSFIESSLEKIQDLSAIRKKRNPDLTIAVDGGVNLERAVPLVDAGANMLIAGSALFKSESPANWIREFKEKLK